MNGTELGRRGRTNLVPWNFENCVLLNNPCTACPNSWKKVTASATLKRMDPGFTLSPKLKEGFHTVVRHQRWAFGSRFSQIGDHGHCRVVPGPVRFEVSRNQAPYRSVRVLGSFMATQSQNDGTESDEKCALTPWEQIEVAIPNEIRGGFGILLPNGILLDLCQTS